MPKLTAATVNAELARRGISERLRRGAGYFYFHLGDAASWPRQGVYVFTADQLTLQQWLAEWAELSGLPLPERKQ